MSRKVMVIDTETTSLEGRVYDIGYTITNCKGATFQTRSYLVEEIFTNAPEMMGAFYAKKFFSYYARALQDGELTLKPWNQIAEIMRSDFLEYDVKIVAAYNLPFDLKVIRNTHKSLGLTSPILGPAKQLCIWRFAKQVTLNSKSFRRWAHEQELTTPTRRAKTTAEVAYRWMFGDWDYIEPHTALEDAVMETKILSRLMQAKKKIPWLKP